MYVNHATVSVLDVNHTLAPSLPLLKFDVL